MIRFFLLTVIVHQVLMENSCFFEECRCVKNIDNSYDVMCVNPSNLTIPIRAKHNINETINTFLIKQFKFTIIPDNFFDGLKIRNLIIGENNLEKITKNTFKGIKSLSLLKIIEKSFEVIEPGALDPLSGSLNEIGIWQINYKSQQIDRFFNELSRLKNLRILSLMGYGLDKFKSEWKQVFNNVSYLSLSSNDLKTIESDMFKSCTRLESLDLSNNFLNNLTGLFEALEPVRGKLRELKLGANYLSGLESFSRFPNLQYLDLSNNKIFSINKTTFSGLNKLVSLYLSANILNSVSENSFDDLTELNTLMLDNNQLSSVPRVEGLKNLRLLDISNQNGKLKSLGDFSFSRKSPLTSVYLILDMNEIQSFGDKAFCSRGSNVSEIRKIDLSYNSTSNMNQCLVKQLNSKISNRVEFYVALKAENMSKKSSTDKCDCKLKKYTQSVNVELVGPCADLAGVCSNDFKLDECDKKYEC